jgi:catechol 2,3-dioxygenase-like lactoylglutathione lyase family enzyme
MATTIPRDLDTSVSRITIFYIDHSNIVTGVTVDDLDAACKRLDDLKVNWKKRLTDGRMRNVAFVYDPDNYWVEIVQNEKLKGRANW